MKEIKFRAWDSNRKEMCPDCLNSMGSPGWRIGKVLEQFTGLQDKNGKDIYKGDIVEFPESLDDTRYSIMFLQGRLGIHAKRKNSYHFSSLSEHWAVCEIIGNIHENPELLEK